MQSYLQSPQYQQLMAQALQNPGGQSQYPGQAIANMGAQLVNAYSLKNYEKQQQGKEADYAKALSGIADNTPVDSVAITPPITAAGQLGQRLQAGDYNQPTSQAPSAGEMYGRLLSSGNADAIKDFAPGIIKSQLDASQQANQPITPYQRANLGLQQQTANREAQQAAPEYLKSASAARAAGTASAPISAAQQASLDQAKYLASPEYKGKVAGAEASARTAITNVPFDKDTIDFMADQAMAGDKSVLSQLGYGGAGQANRAALRNSIAQKAQARGISGAGLAALNAEFGGLQAGERTLGTRTANVEMAVSEAQQMVPLALAASAKVDRTQFPTLNGLLQAAEKGTGGEDVVRLGIATNSLINTYARAISPSGVPTVSDKDHARELLNQAWSKGQYAAGVDQLNKEMQAARQSPGMVRGEFRSAISGGQTGAAQVPDAPSQQSPFAPQAAPQGGALPQGWSVRVK